MKNFKRIFGTITFWGIGILLFQAVSYMLRPVDSNFPRGKMTGFYGEETDSLDIWLSTEHSEAVTEAWNAAARQNRIQAETMLLEMQPVLEEK